MAIWSGLIGLAAGVLSTLSPCVLPLLPLVLGAAVSQHRFGPVALSAGVALSFVTIGLFVATIGFSVGLDASAFRNAAAILMLGLGAVLLVPQFQVRLATAAGPVSGWLEERFGGFAPTGLKGQFGMGLLLGCVWSPCVGPTLGATSILAAQGKDLGQVVIVMAAFGLGAALPLLLLGLISREALIRWRFRMLQAGQSGKAILGALMFLIGFLILSGLDRRLETFLVQSSPDWLTNLTTRL
jgi:cytochrome c-type biogenesis protein